MIKGYLMVPPFVETSIYSLFVQLTLESLSFGGNLEADEKP